MATISDQTLTTSDARIHYRQGGEGQPLLLIHGMGSSCGSWRRVMAPLAEEFQVFAPCTPGLGDSGRPPRQYTFEEYAEAMFGFMDAVGLDKALVVGHSLGGMLTAQMAASRPERVTAAVMEGCPAWTDEYRKDFIKNVAPTAHPDGSPKPYTMEELKVSYYAPTEETLAEFNADRMKPGPWSMEWLRTLSVFDIRGAIAKVRVPSLVVFGEAEQYRDQEQYFVDSISGSRLVIIPKSAHTPHQEMPEEFLGEVVPFLKEHAGG